MPEMYCPNCGHHLVGYRTERQRSGNREVDLEWTICTHCRHVGLQSWQFANGVLPNGNRHDDRDDGQSHRHHESMQFHSPGR